MRRCRGCLCNSCIRICEKCSACKEAVKSCENQVPFRQLSMFELSKPYRKKLIRDYTWSDYGISKKRYKELKGMCQSGKYASLVRSVAHTASKDIELYIYLSVTKNMSYEGLQRLWELREIERMTYCRTDFYGYRRLFYHLLDLEIKKR